MTLMPCPGCEGWGTLEHHPKTACGECDGTGVICIECGWPDGHCTCKEDDLGE